MLAAGLRLFLRFLHASGGPDLLSFLPRVPPPRPRTRILTPDEINILLARSNALMRAAITLMLDTACRAGEVIRICPEHYNPQTQTLTVPQVKGQPPKLIPAGTGLRSLFESLPPAPPLTPVLEVLHGRPVGYFNLNSHWQTLKRKCGLPRDLRMHDLRRTTATALHQVSHDIFAVQQLLGHRTLHATAYYISHADPEKLRPLLKLLETPANRGGKPN